MPIVNRFCFLILLFLGLAFLGGQTNALAQNAVFVDLMGASSIGGNQYVSSKRLSSKSPQTFLKGCISSMSIWKTRTGRVSG